MERRSKFIISEGVRPMWQTFVAAALYTLTFILLAMFFFGYELFPEEAMDSRWNFRVFSIAIACAAQGVLFSSVKSIFFDLDNKKLRKNFMWALLVLVDGKTFPK